MKAFAVVVQILSAPIAVITGLGAVFELLKSESSRALYFGVAPKEQAEKAREKYPERLSKRIGVGVIRIKT